MTMRSIAARRYGSGEGAWTWPRVRLPARPLELLLPLALPALLLVAWQLVTAAGWLSPQVLPAPALVLSTLIDLIRGGDIAANLQISLWRISIGFAIGAGAGLAFGIMLGVSRTLDQYFGPLFRALAQVPSLGWVPILMLIFG